MRATGDSGGEAEGHGLLWRAGSARTGWRPVLPTSRGTWSDRSSGVARSQWVLPGAVLPLPQEEHWKPCGSYAGMLSAPSHTSRASNGGWSPSPVRHLARRGPGAVRESQSARADHHLYRHRRGCSNRPPRGSLAREFGCFSRIRPSASSGSRWDRGLRRALSSGSFPSALEDHLARLPEARLVGLSLG